MNIITIIKKFNIASEREDYDIIHDTVEKGIYFRGTNLWILIFAIIIACVGLNVNSTAVIIGAMLISPLMGPILGIGYSLATYEFSLLKKALTNFGFAVASSLVASTCYFFVTPINEAHSELLARTQPNIYDVLIALFGGLAGIVALSSKQKGNVIPGVAIATALMPPLCTAGYGLATANWPYFFGAFYLFTINTVFIAAATLVIVRFLKYPIWHETEEGLKKSANRWVSFIVTITMIPSLYFGYILVQQERFNQHANTFIRNETYIEDDYLLSSEVDPSQRSIRLVYGGKPITDEEKSRLESKINNYPLEGTTLIIQQGFSISDGQDELQAMGRSQSEISRLRGELAKHLQRQDSIARQKELGKQLLAELQPIFPEIRTCGASEQVIFGDSLRSSIYQALIVGSTNSRKTNAEKQKLEQWFRSRLDADSIKVYIEAY
ncbi:DUF389 domain-containing protein [Parapedobacter tibetensis]|uniref:DUF389 domain-containing protein n=1 Tax=Parapedobacter tibetensis TaxID=2972951 RepID=UPI00214D1FAC|nr:DUF389 domain-containing protein [Parapedobacter tibetensis]